MPARKLHAVRLSTVTLLAFHTTIPLRPTGLPPAPVAPKFWAVGSELQVPVDAVLGAVDDDRVPVHAPEVDARGGDHHPTHVPVGGVGGDARLVGILVVVARGHEDPVARLGRVDGRLDGRVRAGDGPGRSRRAAPGLAWPGAKRPTRRSTPPTARWP